MKLTKAQERAASCKTYPCFLTAGAGTGKTLVLVDKIGRLVAAGESLEHIAAITFTNKATDELRDRLYRDIYTRWQTEQTEHLRMQAEMCAAAPISTIHGFCDRILRSYGTAIGISPGFRVTSFREQAQAIAEAVFNQHRDDPALEFLRQYRIVDLVLLLMTDNNNRGTELTRELVAQFAFNTPDNEFFNRFKQAFVQIYLEAFEQIEREKVSRNILTLTDTIKRTAELLRDPLTAARVAAQFSYVLVDEFQDVDRSQYEIITTLIRAGTKVFIVGDEKQSIFRFRGADVQNVAAMQAGLSMLNIKTMEIAENFRADSPLIDVVNRVFQHSYTYAGKPIPFPNNSLMAPKTAGTPASEKPFELIFNEHVINVVQRLLQCEKLHGQPIQPGEIAVLCRNNADIDRVAVQLKASGVPAEVFGGRGFYRSCEVIDTCKLLRAILYKDETSTAELMFTDYYLALKRNANGFEMKIFLQQLDAILRQSTIDNALLFAYEKSGILDYYRSEQRHQAAANLGKLRSLVQEKMETEWLQPIGFLEYLELMIRSKKEEDEAEVPCTERSGGFVTISSVHKAKGLTFPVVVIPNCDKQLIRPISHPKIIFDCTHGSPQLAFDHTAIDRNSKTPDKDYLALLNDELMANLAEELRILYVAMTRARHKVIALTDKHRRDVLGERKITWAGWLDESIQIDANSRS